MVWNETQLNNKCYCSVTKATSLNVIGSYSLTLITDLISPGCFSDTIIGLMVPLPCGQKCQLWLLCLLSKTCSSSLSSEPLFRVQMGPDSNAVNTAFE